MKINQFTSLHARRPPDYPTFFAGSYNRKNEQPTRRENISNLDALSGGGHSKIRREGFGGGTRWGMTMKILTYVR